LLIKASAQRKKPSVADIDLLHVHIKMSRTMTEALFIEFALSDFAANPKEKTAIFCPPLSPNPFSSCPALILWNPIQSFGQMLKCGKCQDGHLLFCDKWTNKRHAPRLLYHTGRNVRLVSALYLCGSCNTETFAHAENVLKQLDGTCDIPFVLFNKSGVTRSVYGTINDCVAAGMTFHSVQDMFRSQAERSIHREIPTLPSDVERAESAVQHSESDTFKIPSIHMIRDIFMHNFSIKKPGYDRLLASFEPTVISLDHTFEIR
jgi:hypothetical protein